MAAQAPESQRWDPGRSCRPEGPAEAPADKGLPEWAGGTSVAAPQPRKRHTHSLGHPEDQDLGSLRVGVPPRPDLDDDAVQLRLVLRQPLVEGAHLGEGVVQGGLLRLQPVQGQLGLGLARLSLGREHKTGRDKVTGDWDWPLFREQQVPLAQSQLHLQGSLRPLPGLQEHSGSPAGVQLIPPAPAPPQGPCSPWRGLQPARPSRPPGPPSPGGPC